MREPTPDLIRVAARLKLRVAQPDEIVDWAAIERIGGAEGHHLAKLAELGSVLDLAGAEAYFVRAVGEAGYAIPPDTEILRAYARQLAGAILLEAIDPFMACGLVCRVWLQLGQPADLAAWGYLDDGLGRDGRAPLPLDQVASEIRKQAQTLA